MCRRFDSARSHTYSKALYRRSLAVPGFYFITTCSSFLNSVCFFSAGFLITLLLCQWSMTKPFIQDRGVPMKHSALFSKVVVCSALVYIFAFTLGGCGSSEPVTGTTLTQEQQNIRNELFQEADAKLETLEALQAEVLSPGNYETGKEHYKRAEQLLIRDRGVDRIESELQQAMTAFNRAEETADLAKVTFRSTIDARNDALKARAPVFGADNWLRAETQFRTAAESLEAGNVNRARNQAQTAEDMFRAVELEAIKANYLEDARETIRQADAEQAQRNAPKTLAKAKVEIEMVEQMLSEDRYDTQEAGRLAELAAYRASYARYLHSEISRLRNENATFEDLFLKAEEPLVRVAESMDVEVRFDSGFDAPAETIIDAINARLADKGERLGAAQEQVRNLRMENESQASRLREQQSEISMLRSQIDAKGDLAAMLEVQRKRDEAIQNVRNLIPPSDGDVFLDGNNVLIRLHGLTFPVGQATIEPKFFDLLRRVQDAIRLFPDGRITIEGHTDSRGSLELNQRLSEERADAVTQYIRANIGTEFPLRSQGFGPERPVASNETEVGRARNRRIDVVITPGWAD
jgi:OmpA-OmpF porin, OOP family